MKKEVEWQQNLTGKLLDENETLQLRYNVIKREAAKILGAEAQSTDLAREVNELREVIGEKFQGWHLDLIQGRGRATCAILQVS